MKVLLCHRPEGAFGYISDGWQNALRDKGHDTRRWDGKPQSWYEFEPDLYIGCSGHRQPIPKSRNCKVAIHVNPYGPVEINGINESEQNVKWVVEQKPDVVFGYGQEDDRLIWSGWTTEYGLGWVPMPCAADTVIFKQIKSCQERDIDMVYLGGRWPYKAKTIDTYLIPAITNAKERNKKVALRGWGEWPKDLCDGILASDRANAFLNSGKIGPCISELHTQMFGIDIPERAFKLAACGTLVVHDAVMHLRRLIPSAVVAASPEHFGEMCMHYMDNDAERIALVKKQQEEVLTSQTYHHRMSSLLAALEMHEQARQMIG